MLLFKRFFLLCLITLTAFSTPSYAKKIKVKLEGKTPNQAGNYLERKAERYHKGWKTAHSETYMILRDDKGKETPVKMLNWALEAKRKKGKKKRGAKTIIKFGDQGSALITFMGRRGDDVQWFWASAQKRKWRIETSAITGPFIGSEFAIEDLRSQYPEKYDTNYLGEEELDGAKTWKLERNPVNKATGYSKIIVWMDQKHFRVMKSVFYDKKGELLKTLTALEWKKYKKKYWRAKRLEMVNHQTSRTSAIVTRKTKLGVKLRRADFNPNGRIIN